MILSPTETLYQLGKSEVCSELTEDYKLVIHSYAVSLKVTYVLKQRTVWLHNSLRVQTNKTDLKEEDLMKTFANHPKGCLNKVV